MAIEGIISTAIFLIILMLILSNLSNIFRTHAYHINSLAVQAYADSMASYIGALISSKADNIYALREIKEVDNNYWDLVNSITPEKAGIFYYITVEFPVEIHMVEYVEGEETYILITSEPPNVWVNVYTIGKGVPPYAVEAHYDFTPTKVKYKGLPIVVICAGGIAVYNLDKSNLKIIDGELPPQVSDKYLLLYFTDGLNGDPGWGVHEELDLSSLDVKPPLVIIYEDKYIAYPDLYPKIEIPDPGYLTDVDISAWMANAFYSSNIVEVEGAPVKISVYAFTIARD